MGENSDHNEAGGDFIIRAMQQQFTRLNTVIEGLMERLGRLEQPAPGRQ